MNKFIKIEKYRSIHTNQIVFLYTSTEQSENEIKKTIAPTLVWKGIKYLGIKLTIECARLVHWKLQKIIERN